MLGVNVAFSNDSPRFVKVAKEMAQAATASGFGKVFDSGVSDCVGGSSLAAIQQQLTKWSFEFRPRGNSAFATSEEIRPAGIEAFNALRSLEKNFLMLEEGGVDLLIGFGKADITGPIAMVNMMGYVTPSQKASGLHGRLYARTIYASNIGQEPIIFISLDFGMGSWKRVLISCFPLAYFLYYLSFHTIPLDGKMY